MKKIRLYALDILPIFPLMLALTSLSVKAGYLVVVGPTCLTNQTVEIKVDADMTVGDFKSKVLEAGYKPDTVRKCDQPMSFRNKKDNDQFILVLKSNTVNRFSASKILTEKEKDDLKFKQDIYNGNIREVIEMLDKFHNVASKFDFLRTCTAVEDHNKIPLYYACRRGHVELIDAIRVNIGDDKFSELMTILDSEKRTLLMAAAQASNDETRVKTIELIKNYTPRSLWKALDDNQCSAYDWAIIRYHTDSATLQALADTRETSGPLTKKVSSKCRIQPAASEL